jgi:serine/threonine protein kinase
MTTGKHREAFSTEGPLPRLLGPYVLASQLGEGGMGRVYLALSRDKHGEHLQVVKRFGNPRAQFTTTQILENQERFRREAELTMEMSHPSIARTFTSVHHGSASYLVQEFIHGFTLDHLLVDMQEHLLPIPLAAHIVVQIAGALQYVHAFRGMGLIHRDLTAENVMFSRTGEVKVIDFGIAKATLLDETLTKPNIVVGKPLWTAPEVAEGAKPDHRADLYALGMLSWYLFSGHNPEGFLDETHPSLPSPSRFNPEVSAHIDAIVAKALHPNPKQRFQTAQELLDVVSPLIPEGYQGAKELARLVVGYQPVLELDYLNAMIAATRPLLDQICPAPKPFARRKVFPIAILLVAAAFAIGTAVLLRAKSRQHSGDTTAPRLPSPIPSSPPVSPKIPAQPTPLPSEPSPQVPPPHQTQAPLPVVAPSPTAHLRKGTGRRNHHADTDSLTEHSSSDLTPEQLIDDALEAFTHSKFSEALAMARASIKIRPEPTAYVLIGRVLFESDPAGAQDALDTALRLAPGNRQAARLLEELKQRNP